MSEVEKVISTRDLVSLVKEAERVKKKTSSIAGEFGDSVKYAAENKHLHKGAFGLVAKLHRMDALKRVDFRRALALYLDKLDETLWKGEGDPDLADQGEDADAEGSAQQRAASNVTALKSGIKEMKPKDKPAGLPGSPAEAEAEGQPVH